MSTKIEYYFKKPERFPFPDFFDGITETYEILARAITYLKKLLVEPDVRENHGEVRGNSPNLHGNYYIGEGTVIYNDVTIIGPAYIGRNCEIMPGAVIRPNTIIADGCSVGHGSEVKRCVMFGGSKVASLAFAGDCVLGASARIGSGVITANRKFDQTNATIKVKGEKIDLGDSFFGCILGDNSRLGANAVTQPGTHIGPNTWIYPLTNVRGFIPACKRVYHERSVVMEENEIIELKP
ncbi:MAG TPA: glucose-1-phosphate thymidylyltransferase [Clostridiales bacterium]|nr:glucose-1-phosphate thymidylyltransferase [Clostridiales bacterium]